MKNGMFYCDDDYNLYFMNAEYDFKKIDKLGHFENVQPVSVKEMKQRFLLINQKRIENIKLYEDNNYLYLFLFDSNYSDERYYRINKLDLSNRMELANVNTHSFSHRKPFAEIKERNDFRVLMKEMVNDEGLMVFTDGKVRKEGDSYVFVKTVIENIDL